MKARYVIILIIAFVIGCVATHRLISSENTRKVETVMVPEHTATATFAAGCFWGVQSAFSQVKGVISTEAGYTGGHTKDPTYKEVCTDRTGHAESVLVVYDPTVVSYNDLLKVFWAIHDPTTLDRQGPDVGSQYRSVIFYQNAEQQAAAVASKDALARGGKYAAPIVTEIVPATTFYRAEEYHQDYLKKHGEAACPVPKF
jgi:peptide-methionine (S)-S-oxide reductase